MEIRRYRKPKPQQQPDLFHSTTSLRSDVQGFIAEWNSKIWLPKIIATDRQCSMIRDALARPFFKAHWQESFKNLAKSHWLLYKKKPPFRLDWFLEPDNFDKVIEGFYIDQKEEKKESTNKTIIIDGEERII